MINNARKGKTKEIERFYKLPMDVLLRQFYIEQSLSTIEITEKIKRESRIIISPRSIQKKINNLGIKRSFSEAFRLAIQKGRKSYDNMRKPIKAVELRRGITLKIRYSVLKSDNFRCRLCGTDAKATTLEIDHIVPVVNGGKNERENLRTLCKACNRGKRFAEHER